MKMTETKDQGTRCITYADRMVLQWNDLLFTKTVPINRRSSNIGQMYSVAGFKRYNAFAATTEVDFLQENKVCCFRLEVNDAESVIVEDTDTADDDVHQGITETKKADILFKMVQLLQSENNIPATERDEATTASAKDELL
jgi:predicted  nucleic acid-binding Zn ribbon protein